MFALPLKSLSSFRLCQDSGLQTTWNSRSSPRAQEWPSWSHSLYTLLRPLGVKAFQGAGLEAWGSECRTEDTMNVANFDYWKELLKKQQLVKAVSLGESGHCFCQDQDPAQTELCFLYSGYSSIQNQGKGLDCITCSGSRRFLNTEPNSGAMCLLRPQGQMYISGLKKTLGKCPVRLHYRKQTKLGQS